MRTPRTSVTSTCESPFAMNRRDVLIALGATPLAGCGLFSSDSAPLHFKLPSPPTLHVETRMALGAINANALGVSLETATLADPDFLRGGNSALVGLLRGLGPRGVLRLGGRSSDTALWQSTATAVSTPYTCSVDDAALARLASLLDACGWSLIYGIDFAHGSPQRAAAEAAAVQRLLGNHLLAVQLGNAPDRYVDRGWRNSSYDADTYAGQWHRFAQSVRDAAPGIPLAGPEAASLAAGPWTKTFLDHNGKLLHLVTTEEDGNVSAHGKQAQPATHAELLKAATERDQTMRSIVASARNHALPAWITQAGMSRGGHTLDTLEAALWSIWTFYRRQRDGWAGTCFHGALRHDSRHGPQSAAALAGPIYYGLRLLAQTLPGQLVAARLSLPPTGSLLTPPPATLQAWAVLDARERPQLVLLNADRNQSVDLRITADRKLRGGSILRLTGPGFDATGQVTLASSSVDADGAWQPQYTDTVQWADNYGWLTLGAASAALVVFD